MNSTIQLDFHTTAPALHHCSRFELLMRILALLAAALIHVISGFRMKILSIPWRRVQASVTTLVPRSFSTDVHTRLPRASASLLRASVEKRPLDKVKDILGDKCEADSATVKLLCELYEAQLREKESLVRETVREKESLVRETVREKESLVREKESLVRETVREKELLLALKDRDIEMQKKLLHDIQSRDYLSGGRSLLEYAEQFIMKDMNLPRSRVEKWTNFFKNEELGQRILHCVETKIPTWQISPARLAEKLKYMYWEDSDPHHADSYMINDTKKFTLRKDSMTPQMVKFVVCIAECLDLNVLYSKEWLEDAGGVEQEQEK